jgi:FkbH-like protein
MFVDDSAHERERVRQSLPEVTVLGDDLFALRRILLTDPRLQSVRMTDEAAARSDLVKAQLDRQRLRAELPDQDAFLAGLDIVSTVERLTAETATQAVLDRVQELFARTTQFNATGRRFTALELRGIIAGGLGQVFILHMADRLADHGLVGAAVLAGGEILNFVMSCRVIGLGGERVLLGRMAETAPALTGRIIETERNIPVRHLYRDNGFTEQDHGCWTTRLPESKAA